MQNALIQDAKQQGAAANLLRIVTIDLRTGQVTHQFAYLLTTGSGVSEILALNDHEFLVDERDGKGRGRWQQGQGEAVIQNRLGGCNGCEPDGWDNCGDASGLEELFVDLISSFIGSKLFTSSEIPAKIRGYLVRTGCQGGWTDNPHAMGFE